MKTQMLLRGGGTIERGEHTSTMDGKYGVRIMRGAEYGYTHVWELRNQMNKDHCSNTLGRVKEDGREMVLPGQYESRTVPICGIVAARKEHVYESPQTEKQADVVQMPVPYYHEFDANALAVGIGDPRPADTHHPHRLAIRGHVDGESDDSLDDFDNVRTNPAQTHTPEGYQAVPLCQ
jgi:hypothetical protein